MTIKSKKQSEIPQPPILESTGKKLCLELTNGIDDLLFLKQLNQEAVHEIEAVFALSPFISGALIKKPWLFQDLWSTMDLKKT